MSSLLSQSPQSAGDPDNVAVTPALPNAVREQLREACRAWLMKSSSAETRSNYHRDLQQFFAFAAIAADEPEHLISVRPAQVSAWRDHMTSQGLTNSSV